MNVGQVQPNELWAVELNGWNDAFEAVKHPPAWGFVHDEDRHYLTSSKFDGIADATMVRDTAQGLINKINIAARQMNGPHLHLTVGGTICVRKDGTLSHTQFIKASAILSTAAAYGSTVAGGIQGSKPTALAEVLALSEGPEVNLAARYLAYPPGDPNWAFNLWKFYDVLKREVKPSTMEAKGWTNQNQLSSFRKTVNDANVSGDEARHGGQTQRQDPDLTRRSEAEMFARDLFVKWVRDKYDQQKFASTQGSA